MNIQTPKPVVMFLAEEADIEAKANGNANVKWREQWNGSAPGQGSEIVVDGSNELVIYFGGNQELHDAVTEVVQRHNKTIVVH